MTDSSPPVIAAIIVHRQRVLLVRRRVGEGSLSWQFPAGEQEAGETPFQTAVRETAEEVGLQATPRLVIGRREHPVTGRQMVYVGCEAETGAVTLTDTDELAELGWYDLDGLHRLIPTGLYEPVADYLSQRLA